MRRIILRLMVAAVAVIIVVVGAIAYRVVTNRRITVLRTREEVLRDDLYKMRTWIDQYAVDKGSLPKSLDELVSAGYLREIPEDPFTERRDWVVVVSRDPNLSEGGEGITDLHSATQAISLAGTPYKEW